MHLRLITRVFVTLWCLSNMTTAAPAEPSNLNSWSSVSINTKSDSQSNGNVNEDPYSKFLYYDKTQTYYPYIENSPRRGPCGEHMLLYRESKNSYNGVCLCEKIAEHCAARPLLYWNATQRCYYAYVQGPCGNGEWLINDNKGKPQCQRNTCPLTESTTEDTYISMSDIEFQFKYQNKCYSTNTTAFCKGNKKAFFKGGDPQPVCLTDQPLQCYSGYALANSAPASCPPNTELQEDGSCSKVVSFE